MKKIASFILFLFVIVAATLVFSHYTSSLEFNREGHDLLNHESSLSNEELKKGCEKMSRWAHVSGLTDGAFTPVGRSYYLQSACYHALALRTYDLGYCDKVRTRFLSLGGHVYSPETCKRSVGEALKIKNTNEAESANHKILKESALHIADLQLKTRDNKIWELLVTFKLGMPGKYELAVRNGAVRGLGSAESIVIEEQIQFDGKIKDKKYFLDVLKLSKCDGCENRKTFPISVELILLESSTEGQLHGPLLIDIKNTTLSVPE